MGKSVNCKSVGHLSRVYEACTFQTFRNHTKIKKIEAKTGLELSFGLCYSQISFFWIMGYGLWLGHNSEKTSIQN